MTESTIDQLATERSTVNAEQTNVSGTESDLRGSISSPNNYGQQLEKNDLRRIARLNLKLVTPEIRVSQLHAERRDLVRKKFVTGLTSAEASRLEYVRWCIERIEDATHGEDLDRLELLAARYRDTLDELRHLQRSLADQLPKPKKGTRQRR